MTTARIFIPHEALERWVSEQRGQVMGETLMLEGVAFDLSTAVRFSAEVAGGGDELGLVGKVKTLEQITALGGEHCAASVVLGDNAYEVVEGFLAQIAGASSVSSEKLIKLMQNR